jgi:sugar-specific transcriptional regulator TrmB
LVQFTPSIPETFTAVSPLTVLNAKAREIADQAASVLEVVQKLAEEYALKANCSVGLELPREANELWHIDGRKHIYQRISRLQSRRVSIHGAAECSLELLIISFIMVTASLARAIDL